MSKIKGALFSKSLFGYRKRDVNEYIRMSDESNSEKINACENKIKSLEETLVNETSSFQAQIKALEEERDAALKNAESSARAYEENIAGLEARASSYLKLADDASSKNKALEEKVEELSAYVAEKEAELQALKEKTSSDEKMISELNATVARLAMQEKREKSEPTKHTRLRRPIFFRFIRK